MSKIPWVFVAALTVASGASAEIFKCGAKDGATLYKNFPCDIDSLGSLPSQPAASLAPPAESTPAKASSAMPDKAGKTAALRPPPAEPRIGMTFDEVRAIWGEPSGAYSDELVEGRADFWSYGDTRSVKFDVRGRVVAIQR